MRYTLDKSNPIEHEGKTLYRVLDRGEATEAFAVEGVEFADDCEVVGGHFYGGTFRGGTFHGGTFYGGVFHGGKYYGGKYCDGYFYGGVFYGGTFHDGRFKGGTFYGGDFRGGFFLGGTFNGGDFHGGAFYGGYFHGGAFYGGCFHGGTFHGGDFFGGDFNGGKYKEGWLPLQIQGSKHFVNIPDGRTIQIGCECGPVDCWRKKYERIGRCAGYTQEQIKEYKRYIDLAAEMIKENT
jgi:hypothetical protein